MAAAWPCRLTRQPNARKLHAASHAWPDAGNQTPPKFLVVFLVYLGMQPEPVSTAQSPSFWSGPVLARSDPKVIGLGLARHGGAARAWAALQPRRAARPGLPNNDIAQNNSFGYLNLFSTSVIYI